MTPARTDSPALGVVVAGTGFGCITHVRALRAAGFNVVALIGRDPDRTGERARQFDVPLALTSIDEALALDSVDAVTIATPPHTHADLAHAAIAVGKHVICEKPFARNAAEGREVLAAAEAAGIVHLLGTEFRWDVGQATLARVVRAGAIGDPRLATVVMQVPMLADPAAEVPAWWASEESGGGWFGAHGSQVIDQLRVTLGEFAGVSATLAHVGEASRSADDGFVVHFEMRSGCTGAIVSTAADWGLVVITRVAGTSGTAWIEGIGATVMLADADGTRAVPVDAALPTGAPEPLPRGVLHTAYDRMIAHGLDLGPYTSLAAAFRDRILGVEPADIAHHPGPATFADGVAGMAVLDVARQSAAKHGAWIAVDAHTA